MKIKIEIKHFITGALLFELETEGNTLLKTVKKAVAEKRDLTGAYLTGANLTGAYLRGAYLRGRKFKTAAVFSGLYKYIVIPYITEENEKRVKMGCNDRTLDEWNTDFWNNNSEFANDGSVKSKLRVLAFNTAKAWFDIVEETEGK